MKPKAIIAAAFLIGLCIGLFYRPYQITSSGSGMYGKTFKINRVTGRSWSYDGRTWIEVQNN